MIRRLEDWKIGRLYHLFVLSLIFFTCLVSRFALTSSIESNRQSDVSHPPAGEAGQSSVFSYQRSYLNTFFSYALEHSDLDVRDSKNRPVKSSAAKAELRELFFVTVYRLLVDDALPIISSARKYLETFLTPFREQFNRAKKRAARITEPAVLFNFKRAVEHLMICMFFVAFALQCCAALYRFSNRQSSIVNLQINLPLLC